MATYSANVEVNQTLVASTVDTVTINSTVQGKVRVINETGTNPIYVNSGTISASFTQGAHGVENSTLTIVQPTAPTVGGANEFEIPALAGASITIECGPSGAILSLISSGAMAYSVLSADAEDVMTP